MPLGITLKTFEPLSETGLYAREFIDDITANHERGTFTISAVGGFEQSRFTLKGDIDYIDDWYNDGLMRRIVWENPEGVQIWEGYIHRLRYNHGSLTKTKSIDNMFNRIYLRYSPLDTSVSPPVALAPQTLVVDDIDSQNLWGVKSAVIAGGERADATVYDWGRTVLKEKKDVPEGESVNTSRSSEPSLGVECRGYYHTLKWLPYIAAKTGRIQAHEVIQEILEFFNLTNQAWISQDFDWIDYNFRKARRGYDELKSCWDVIADIIREGGAGGERWVGGLYQNRQFVYKQAESLDTLYGINFDLYRSLTDQGLFIFDVATGTEVKPWDLVPDRILHTTDVNIGGTKDLTYLEQTTFTEPYAVKFVGGDDERLPVFLAQRGLPGI